MKRLVTLICILHFACYYGFSQDIIVKKDGTTIKAKVTKVSDSEVEYKKYEPKSDRLYTTKIANIQSINYEDGSVDRFNSETSTAKSPEPTAPQQTTIPAQPTSDNNQIVAQYNKPIKMKGAQKNKVVSRAAILIMGVTNNSILSTDEIEVGFISKIRSGRQGPFQISVKNKTNNMLYVDLGSTFITGKDGISHSYYKTDVVTTTTGGKTGGAFNLGGVAGALGVGGAIGSLAGATTIGSSSSSGISTTHQMQRVLAIPPHGMNVLSAYKETWAKNDKTVISYNEMIPGESIGSYLDVARFYDCVVFADQYMLKKPLLCNEVIEYTPENSLGLNKYQITYTTDPNFLKLNTVTFDTYLKYIIGADTEKKPWNLDSMYKKTLEGEITDNICDVWYEINWSKPREIGPRQ